MSRIGIPTFDQTPAATRPLLDAVSKQLGVVPNLMSVLGNSPAALGGYLGLSDAVAKGALGARPAASAQPSPKSTPAALPRHTYLSENVAKLDDAKSPSQNGAPNDQRLTRLTLCRGRRPRRGRLRCRRRDVKDAGW
jgi:hypothetical protein